MQIIASLDKIEKMQAPLALTIGTFDGMHLGHVFLIKKMQKLCGKTAVVTYSSHPLSALDSNQKPLQIYPLNRKLEIMAKLGIDLALVLPFREIMELSYDQFLGLLMQKLPISHLVLGSGAAFGKERGGTEEKVKAFGANQGFEVLYIEKLKSISSTQIRRCISANDLIAAEKMLGRPL